MSVLFYLVIVCLADVSYGSPTLSIVGGESAKIGEFPYMISIRWWGKHWCGGSIIDRRHILTAAHCIEDFVDKPNELTVHAGTNYLNETGDEYHVEKVIPHSNWDINTITNDIGLLRLDKDIQFKSTVKPIAPATTKVAQAGDPCTVCGWGYLRLWSEKPNDLQKLNLLVFSQTKCKSIWEGWQMPDRQICAYAREGKGACQGDSGGPLVSKGVQIGIVSYARPCAFGVPDVYTRVSAYKQWIDEHTKL